MTIVAAAIGEDGVWIGSDGMSTGGGVRLRRRAKKWLLSPGRQWALGLAGESTYQCAFEDLLRSEDWPDDTSETGARALTAAMRQRLDEASPAVTAKELGDSIFRDWAIAPILASPAGIWRAASDLWCVYGPEERRCFAYGSGEDFALGAMHAVGGASAAAMVRAAVDAACALSTTCGGEQWFRQMGRP